MTGSTDVSGCEELRWADVEHERAMVHEPDHFLRRHRGVACGSRPHLEGDHGERRQHGSRSEPGVIGGVFDQPVQRSRPGAKKGAHYTRPRLQPVTRQPVAFAAMVAVTCVLAAALALGQGGDTRETEAELAAVRAAIERVRAQVERDEIERDRLTKALRTAEQSIGAARAGLERLRRERAERAARRAELATQKRQSESEIRRGRAALADQVRAAYIIGREEPLRLLLNQEDPARAGRMLASYGYFGRARAGHIERIAASVRRLEELDAELASEEQRLASLEAERRAELTRLEQARARRGTVLASLTAESRSRTQSLAKLRDQKAALEKLLRELKRAMEAFPVTGKEAFAKLRGKLAWPVAGRLVARFGESRAGGVKWDGVVVETERGTPVRSVHNGRIVYADWLPGLGLLAIVDHGEGYLSLYGHNERLYKAAGERVVAGDTIAAAGDSGGRSRPELYFEIRKGGKPVDPRPWFKSGSPRATP
jgi:septal ring factor EnvC (AmiA/AmiB activator)